MHGKLDRDEFFSVQSDQTGKLFVREFDKAFYGLSLPLPPKGTREVLPTNVHLLVDCSGSMQGQSNELSKSALTELVNGLGIKTKINHSAFGSDHQMMFEKPERLQGLKRKTLVVLGGKQIVFTAGRRVVLNT